MNFSRKARSFLPVAVLGFHAEAGWRASFSETAARMNPLRLASGMRLRSDNGIFTVTACSLLVIPKRYYLPRFSQACSYPRLASRFANFFNSALPLPSTLKGLMLRPPPPQWQDCVTQHSVGLPGGRGRLAPNSIRHSQSHGDRRRDLHRCSKILSHSPLLRRLASPNLRRKQSVALKLWKFAFSALIVAKN